MVVDLIVKKIMKKTDKLVQIWQECTLQYGFHSSQSADKSTRLSIKIIQLIQRVREIN